MSKEEVLKRLGDLYTKVIELGTTTETEEAAKLWRALRWKLDFITHEYDMLLIGIPTILRETGSKIYYTDNMPQWESHLTDMENTINDIEKRYLAGTLHFQMEQTK